jgi:hypothetical protein
MDTVRGAMSFAMSISLSRAFTVRASIMGPVITVFSWHPHGNTGCPIKYAPRRFV